MSVADWCQYNIELVDHAAEQVAVNDLFPALIEAEDAGLLRSWWFVRKRPWKLRCLPGVPDGSGISELLDRLAASGRITGWTHGIYEPETTAFGGPAAMDLAHKLFHQDSRFLFARAARRATATLGQRETTVLLCSAMLRAANLDWYEQGDVWAKLAELRPDRNVPADRAVKLSQAMRRLMTVDARALCEPTADGPLTGYDGWISAFEQAGLSLADLARRGGLKRGLRAVLAHHIVFHANRAGLSLEDQAVLAALAVDTVFVMGGDHTSAPSTTSTTTKVT